MYRYIYAEDTPELIIQLSKTSAMQRLAGVGMHCGCEYTKVPLYQKERSTYTRLIHSVGVSKIVWNFTHDIRQAVAGLLHDIATPAFAHTIDFMRGDYLTQESTEDRTLSFIENSEEITELLSKHHIRMEDVSDYHKYPIADNDTPMLSADRLEYTIGNGYHIYHMEAEKLGEIYKELTVSENEHGTEELCFRSLNAALNFIEISQLNSHYFVSDENRFSMQYLADIMRSAMNQGLLGPDDLYTTETEVIQKLNTEKEIAKLWKSYTEITSVMASADKPKDCYSVNVSAKKRFIDPLVLQEGKPRRLTEIDSGIRDRIQTFLNTDFNSWIFL